MADGKERLIKRSGWPYHDIKHFRGGQERTLVGESPIIKVYIRWIKCIEYRQIQDFGI